MEIINEIKFSEFSKLGKEEQKKVLDDAIYSVGCYGHRIMPLTDKLNKLLKLEDDSKKVVLNAEFFETLDKLQYEIRGVKKMESSVVKYLEIYKNKKK